MGFRSRSKESGARGRRLGAGALALLGLIGASCAAGYAQSQASRSIPAAAAPKPDPFELTGFSYALLSTPPPRYALTVTVAQSRADGSDPAGHGTESHRFPSHLWVVVDTAQGQMVDGPFAASLATAPAPALDYPQPGKATAVYVVTLPSPLPAQEALALAPPGVIRLDPSSAGDAFRLVSTSDPSGGDDTVADRNATDLPVGQLPEVPVAAALPFFGLLTAAPWLRRRWARRRRPRSSRR